MSVHKIQMLIDKMWLIFAVHNGARFSEIYAKNISVDPEQNFYPVTFYQGKVTHLLEMHALTKRVSFLMYVEFSICDIEANSM